MAIQTSINIPDDLVAELYRRAPQPDARTALIEEALRCFFATHDAANSDLEILNRYADELNQEAEDVGGLSPAKRSVNQETTCHFTA